MIKLLGLVLLFFNTFSYACSFPITDEKYDALVNVKSIESQNYINETVYVFTFPETVDKLKLDSANLSIYLAADNADAPYIRQPIKLENDNGLMTGVAFSNNKKEFSLYIDISWAPSSPGLCSINVTKKLL